MAEIRFAFLTPEDSPAYAERLFAILYENMSKIAPTGCTRDEDYAFWLPAFTAQLKQENRRVILIFDAYLLVGYFQYCIVDGTFSMEEIQFAPSYQGKHGIFRALYGFVIGQLPPEIRLVKAHASKTNEKSIAVLTKLGLRNTGENKTGRSYVFVGNFADLLHWYHRK